MTAHPLHHPLTSHERSVRGLWIFGAFWLVLWLLVFWSQPVSVYKMNTTLTDQGQNIIRILPSATPEGHFRPGDPKPWERFLLEQGWPVIFLYLILSIPAWLASVLARSRSWWAGGVIGVLVGYLGGWGLVDISVGLAGAVVVGMIGAIFDYVVSTHYKLRLLSGHMPSWWAGGHWGGRGHSQWPWGSVNSNQ